MSKFKYHKDKKEIWAGWPEPKHNEFNPIYHYTEEEINYSRRPYFTVSPEPDWEDGKIVEEKTHFVFEHWCNNQETLKGRPEKVSIVTYQEFQNMKVRKCPSCYLIAIPLPKENYGIL